MEIEDAVHTAILTLKEGMDGALNENLIEGTLIILQAHLTYYNLVGIAQTVLKANRDGLVVPHEVFRSLSAEEVKDYLANIV